MNIFIKPLNSNLDYGFDWKKLNYLEENEVIETSVWEAPEALTLTNEQNTDGVTSVFISGGAQGLNYKVKNTITTNQGREDTRTLQFIIGDKYK